MKQSTLPADTSAAHNISIDQNQSKSLSARQPQNIIIGRSFNDKGGQLGDSLRAHAHDGTDEPQSVSESIRYKSQLSLLNQGREPQHCPSQSSTKHDKHENAVKVTVGKL